MDSFVNVENAFQGDMKEFINNLKDEDYRIYIQKKYDIILESFKKIDKNKDSFIDYDELISFLDDCMGQGKKFNKETADKIMKLIDVDQNGQISISEFSKTFIQIEEELKMHLFQTKLKLDEEEKDRLNSLKFAQQYKNEKINEDNLADNARLNVEINSVSFTKINKRHNNIFLKIIYGSEFKKTSVLNDNDNLVWNEQFEFKVKTLRENLYFEINLLDQITKKEELIGKVKFPLVKLINQDEYEIDIGIPDDYGDGYIATIKTKLQFIRSLYRYYQIQANNSEKIKKELESGINEFQKLLNDLNEPFGFFSQLSNNDLKKFSQSQNGKSMIHVTKPRTKLDEIEEQAADKIENIIKNTFSIRKDDYR